MDGMMSSMEDPSMFLASTVGQCQNVFVQLWNARLSVVHLLETKLERKDHAV